MDMRRAVIVAVDGDIAVGVQLRRLPLPAVVLRGWQGFERGFFDFLVPLAAGDAKAAVSLIVDALDADRERAIDLLDRGKSGAAEPEAKVPTQDLHQPFDDRLVLRLSDPRRNDRRTKMRG